MKFQGKFLDNQINYRARLCPSVHLLVTSKETSIQERFLKTLISQEHMSLHIFLLRSGNVRGLGLFVVAANK